MSIAGGLQGGWTIVGDFNDFDSIGDKKGGLPASPQRCQRMKDRMDQCQISNIETKGPRFTWRGPIFHGGQRIYERLYRALSNDVWRSQFQDAFVKVLMRVEFSDHHPILISLRETHNTYQKRPFRFESAWLLQDSYHQMMKNVWHESESMASNMHHVIEGINQWKLESFDQIKMRKKYLMRRYEGVQMKLQERDNYGGMRNLERKLEDELSSILIQEEVMWFQRSRTKWLADGDRNTKYYHMQTVARRKRNKIVMLKDDMGKWISDHDTLKLHVTMFCKNLFMNSHGWNKWRQTEISFPSINDISLQTLTEDVRDDEVKSALFSMKPWKAPGPDGFPSGFYQKSWDIIGQNLIQFVREVWRNPSSMVDLIRQIFV